jgi:hypothetical protein
MQQQQKQTIPYNVQRSAVQYQLGSPQAIYAVRKESWLHLLPGIGALLIGGAVLAYFFHAYASLFIFWPFWQMALVPTIGVGWSAVGLWIVFLPWFSSAVRIFVYTEGLVYTTRTCEVMRWSQMERLWKDIRFDRKKRKISSYVMRRNDQAFFVFKPNLLDGEKLGMLLEEEITRRLLPRAIVAFDAGDPILFDTIAISPRSIRVKPGRKKLAWSEFERMNLDEQTLEIYKKGQDVVWASLKVVDIPNVEILRGLVRYAQQELEYRQIPSIAAYRAGLSVAFGPLKISQRGVIINNGTLPWNEIAGIGVGESEVMIKRKGNPASWIVFPLWRISDASSLKELINYIMRNSV